MQPNGDDDPRDLATDEPSGSRRSSGTQPVARVAAEDLPLVSVIVPVFNDPDAIRRCVAALHRQSYPSSRYEVIVVDNGSTDGTSQVVNGLGVRMVSENVERGSYAARNAGLRVAVGSVVAFTDADCIPSNRWLEEGVRVMQSERADLVGGRVRFALSTRPSGAEIWDSITNMQIEQNIRERQVAKTANLFVQRSVFDAIGAFPGDSMSGGDVAWTGTATRHGLALVFAE